MAVDQSKKDYLANLYNQEVIIEGIRTNQLKITVYATEEYEGKTFTATNETTEDTATGVVKDGRTIIYVAEGGTYTLTNNLNEKEVVVEVEDLFNTLVNITNFNATIRVTLPEELVGETITCTLEKFNLEKVSDSKTVTFAVNAQGTWKIGVKGIDAITKKEVSVTQDGGSYSTALTLPVNTVPVLRVRSKAEDNGKIIKVTKDSTTLTRVLKDRLAWFILPETGTWKVTCDDYPEIQKEVKATANQTYRVSLRAQIFGVKVNQAEADPAARVTYIDDAEGMQPVRKNGDYNINYGEWRDTWIFEKIHPCMLKTNGEVDYYLDPEDQTKKAGGGVSDISNISYDGNAMVEIDKFYIELRSYGNDAYIRISDEEEDGFVPMGFKRADGTEMDKAYMPMFRGWIDSSGKLRSIAGQHVRCNTSFSSFQQAAQKTGTNYHLETNGLINAMDMLYLIMFKNFDSQTVLGRGRDYNNGSGSVSGTDMTIMTGFLSSRGPMAYDPSSQGIKFMWMEDYWGNNLYHWVDGWLYKRGNPGPMYMKFGGPYNDTGDGYTQVTGYTPSSGNISASVWNNQFGKIPNAFNGSSSTYECDSASTNPGNTSEVYACSRAYSGVWYRYRASVSYTVTHVGAALSFEPSQGA